VTSWAAFAAAEPVLAEAVRGRFAVRKHATLATLRRDGSPRISGTEVEFADGEVWLGSMPGALKAADLRRDPRLALHSPTVDPASPTEWEGEAKLAGVAVEASPDRFRVALTEVVLTRLGEPPDHLLIEAWHPGRGVDRRERR
jgi:hypothetical protein